MATTICNTQRTFSVKSTGSSFNVSNNAIAFTITGGSSSGGTGVSDHGDLTGLLDDDHSQYLNVVRHDALAADNPHSVTISQAVSADAGTDISTAELETLSDGSNADLLHSHVFPTGGHTIQDSGVSLTNRANLNFDGLLQATDDAGNDQTDVTINEAGIDHGNIAGLTNDNHPQYPLVDGTRAFTGPQAGVDPVADTDLATKQYIDGLLDVNFASRLEQETDLLFYFGEAAPGSATSAAVWRIKRVVDQVDGDSAVTWANGLDSQTNVMDDFLTLIYS